MKLFKYTILQNIRRTVGCSSPPPPLLPIIVYRFDEILKNFMNPVLGMAESRIYKEFFNFINSINSCRCVWGGASRLRVIFYKIV